MNFLGHLFLAEGPAETVAGNLLGDFLKGKAFDRLPPAMRDGVRAHRSIDAFTDAHPAVALSRRRLPSSWRRVSGVLVDVYYDHILASRWEQYSCQPLRMRLDEAYRMLDGCSHLLPPDVRAIAQRIADSDLMMSYTRPEGIRYALTRLSRRLLQGQIRLELAMEDLQSQHAALCEDFHGFLPEAVHHIRTRRTDAREHTG